jgi:release factor glutamine methyltransferase
MKTSTTIGKALNEAHAHIKPVSESPNLDVQLILAQVMGRSRTWIAAHGDGELSIDEEAQFHSLIAQRAGGVPLPYLLGWWEFYGRRFTVSESVLIPRPETELLVEEAIEFLTTSPQSRSVADIGTGSGCIAVTLAAEIDNLKVYATDMSIDSLIVARENAVIHEVAKRIEFVQMDLVGALEGPFDLVVANLPYIPNTVVEALEVSKWEPLMALDGGENGLLYFRKMFPDIHRLVRGGGRILLEIDHQAGEDVCSIAKEYLPHAEINLRQDLSGDDRLVSVSI